METRARERVKRLHYSKRQTVLFFWKFFFMHSNGINGKKDKLAFRDSNEEKQFGMQFLHYKCLQKQRSTYVFYMLTVGDVCDKREWGLRVIHKGFPEVNPNRSGVSQTQSISSLNKTKKPFSLQDDKNWHDSKRK